jgi:hypothetical protein
MASAVLFISLPQALVPNAQQCLDNGRALLELLYVSGVC